MVGRIYLRSRRAGVDISLLRSTVTYRPTATMDLWAARSKIQRGRLGISGQSQGNKRHTTSAILHAEKGIGSPRSSQLIRQSYVLVLY